MLLAKLDELVDLEEAEELEADFDVDAMVEAKDEGALLLAVEEGAVLAILLVEIKLLLDSTAVVVVAASSRLSVVSEFTSKLEYTSPATIDVAAGSLGVYMPLL